MNVALIEKANFLYFAVLPNEVRREIRKYVCRAWRQVSPSPVVTHRLDCDRTINYCDFNPRNDLMVLFDTKALLYDSNLQLQHRYKLPRPIVCVGSSTGAWYICISRNRIYDTAQHHKWALPERLDWHSKLMALGSDETELYVSSLRGLYIYEARTGALRAQLPDLYGPPRFIACHDNHLIMVSGYGELHVSVNFILRGNIPTYFPVTHFFIDKNVMIIEMVRVFFIAGNGQLQHSDNVFSYPYNMVAIGNRAHACISDDKRNLNIRGLCGP